MSIPDTQLALSLRLKENLMHKRVVLLLLLPLFLFSGCGYNSLQVKEEKVFQAWSNIEAALQRRADLIPNLVETVKGYAAHERETLEAVVKARQQVSSVKISPEDLGNQAAMGRLQEAQSSLSSALSRLLLVVERYPDLKASQNFLDLQNQLEGTENRINVARQRYNQAVSEFNSSIRKFPYNLTNNFLLHLDKKEYFKMDEGADERPDVSF